MMTVTETFPYAGHGFLYAAAAVDGECWVHEKKWTGAAPVGAPCNSMMDFLAAVRARGTINPAHWRKLGPGASLP